VGGGAERVSLAGRFERVLAGGAAMVSLEEGRRSRPLFHKELAVGHRLLEECQAVGYLTHGA